MLQDQNLWPQVKYTTTNWYLSDVKVEVPLSGDFKQVVNWQGVFYYYLLSVTALEQCTCLPIRLNVEIHFHPSRFKTR